MNEIKLTNSKKVALVDDEDFHRVSQFTWALTPQGYARRNIYVNTNGKRATKKLYLHRFILNPGVGFDVDHINHDRLDNRRVNIRVAPRSVNLLNKTIPANHKTGVHGVRQRGNSWTASISIKNKTTHLGTFRTKREAVDKRLSVESQIINSLMP